MYSDLKLCKVPANSKAKIFFDLCRLFFKFFRIRSHFLLGVNRSLELSKCSYLDALLALDRLGLSDIYDLLVAGILSLSEQHLEMVKLSTSETSSEK